MDALFNFIAKTFNIHNLKDFQKDCIRSLFINKAVFLSYRTSGGISICYETYPLFCYLNAISENVLAIFANRLPHLTRVT